MPKSQPASPVRQQLLPQGRKRRWWPLHSRLWHWQLPSAVHWQRRHNRPGRRCDQWVWLANSRAVCATESTKLVRLYRSEMGGLRMWQCLLIADVWTQNHVHYKYSIHGSRIKLWAVLNAITSVAKCVISKQQLSIIKQHIYGSYGVYVLVRLKYVSHFPYTFQPLKYV